MSDDAPLLAVTDLHAYYGRAHILHGLSLEMRRGEVVALIGRNGAGKSTTLKALIGLVPPAPGSSIRFSGQPIAGWPSHRIARLGLGYVPEERRIFADLTVLENLEAGRQPPRDGAPVWTPEALFELFPNLAEMRHRPGARMSGGEQQMLSIARSLMGNPRAILLDEPSEGLAPVIVEQMVAAIRTLKAEGLTVLLSEQNLRFATAVSDRGYIIETGSLRHHAPMPDLAADPAVARDYLAVG